MKKIKIYLTEKQSLDIWHNKTVEKTSKGMKLYIKDTDEGIKAYTWQGTEWQNVEVISTLN